MHTAWHSSSHLQLGLIGQGRRRRGQSCGRTNRFEIWTSSVHANVRYVYGVLRTCTLRTLSTGCTWCCVNNEPEKWISAHNTIIMINGRGEMQAEQVRSTRFVGHTSEVAGQMSDREAGHLHTQPGATYLVAVTFDAWIRRH